MQEDHCQDPKAIPLTQEEISNLVFKKKSGIVKGLGMRPSSFLVTTASSNSLVEYIQRLENEIIELKEARVRDQEERARNQEARAKQEEAIQGQLPAHLVWPSATSLTLPILAFS